MIRSVSCAVAIPFFRSIWIAFSRLLAERNVVALSKESGNEMSNISFQFEKESKSTHRIETQGRELGLEWDILSVRNENKIPSQDGFQLRIHYQMYLIFG